MRSRISAGVLPDACQPSPSVTTRRNAPALSPPTQMDRLGGEADVVEAIELAVEARAIRGPELLEDAQHLVGLAPAGVERRAEDLDLLLPPADADAADETPIRERVDRGQHLGHQDGMAMAENEHRGAEPRFGRAHRGRGEQGDRLQVCLLGRMGKPAARVARGREGKDDVIAHPERRHPEPLGLAGKRRNRVAGGDGALHRKLAADVHGRSLQRV